MGQLDRATVLPRVPLDALRKRIGGVADEYKNQAASREYHSINTLRACNRRLRALPGNSIELPHALRKMTTGGVTHDDSNHAASREHQPIRTMNACNTRHRNRGNSTGELNSVPLNALRKRTGGVSNEDINQAAPGQLQPISALHARNMPGNSTGVLYCPVFHHTYALRKITGGVTDDEKKSSRKRGIPTISTRYPHAAGASGIRGNSIGQPNDLRKITGGVITKGCRSGRAGGIPFSGTNAHTIPRRRFILGDREIIPAPCSTMRLKAKNRRGVQ